MGVEYSREPTRKEWEEWRLNKARLDKLFNDLKEQGIDYKELMLKDRDLLTPEEGVIGATLMELMMKVTLPVTEDRLKKEREVFSDILGVPMEATEEGFVVEMPPTPTEWELRDILKDFKIPEDVLYKKMTRKECVRVIDTLTERKPYTEAQRWLILKLTGVVSELPY